KIKSLAGEPCIVRPGFEGSFKTSNSAIKIKELGDGQYELVLDKGQEITLYTGDSAEDFSIKPCKASGNSRNFWGLKK
ncbi:MAG: hypothetical protein LBR18_08230, partial [Tannerella sp.]|nr:hypothetical protein [Tannerella sp.]